ncbi:glycosyltransferase family 39 protein [bacterium]|nr:glycosyltransferase family 39 protein [bacterium]
MVIHKIKRLDPVLLIAVGGGLIFRLLLWKTVRFMIGFDEANYLRLAGHALGTNILDVLHPYWSPFYPFAVWCFSIVCRNPETAGRLVNILVGTGMIPLMYLWSRRLFGSASARITALMLAVYPPLAFDNTAAMPEAIYSFAGLSGMLFGWHALTRHRWGYGLLAGICWGFAYLSKPEGVGFLIVFGIFSLIRRMFLRKRTSWKKTGIVVLVTAAGFLCMASPYLVYLKQSTGIWTISTKGMLNQQMEASVTFNDAPVKDPLFHVTSDNRYLPYDMGLHFGNFHELKSLDESKERIVQISLRKHIIKITKNLYQLMKTTLPQLFGLVLLIFLVLGFFNSQVRFQKFLVVYLLLFVGFYWFGMVPLFRVNTRYLMPLVPVFFIWIGHGSLVFYHWLMQLSINQRRFSKRGSAACIFILFLGGVFLLEISPIFNQRHPGPEMWAQPLELKQAATWLKSRTDHPPRLMTLNKAIDFYAGQYDMTQGASFSYDSIEKNLAYARHRNCEYLVFTSRYLPWFENLKPLISGSVPPGLERIYDKINAQGIRTVIYRVKDSQ